MKTNAPLMELRMRLLLALAGFFILAGSRLNGAEPVLKPTTADWPAEGLGNVRVRLTVPQKAEAVWAHIPWRRRDDHPERKATLIFDATTGRQITNAIRARVDRECGDIIFQPVTAPGDYYLYYLRPGKTLVSLASWAPNEVSARLALNTRALGLDPATLRLRAPLIQDFQPEARFRPGDSIPVKPGKGWLLYIE